MFVVLQKEDHLSRNRFETAVWKIFRARNWMVKTNNTREKQYFRYYYPKWKVGVAIESNKKEAFRFLRCTKGSAIDPVPGWRGEEGGYPWQGSGLPVEREAAHNSVDAINLTRGGGPAFHGQPLATRRTGRGECERRAARVRRVFELFANAAGARGHPLTSWATRGWFIRARETLGRCSLRCRATRREKGLETQARGFLRCVRYF